MCLVIFHISCCYVVTPACKHHPWYELQCYIYNVFGGTLNPTQPTNLSVCLTHVNCALAVNCAPASQLIKIIFLNWISKACDTYQMGPKSHAEWNTLFRQPLHVKQQEKWQKHLLAVHYDRSEVLFYFSLNAIAVTYS